MARRTGLTAAGLALVALVQVLPASAAEVAGAARVIDGDTLAIGATRVRLYGIDAPEAHQRCVGGGGTDWDCGRAAAARLTALAAGAVRCDGDEFDRYGRLLARCRAGGIDLGGRLVAEGLAWAYVKYSDAYVAEETGARARHAGLWQGQAEAPWDFRAAASRAGAGDWTAAAGTVGGEPPAGCLVKGNVSGKGARIYHLPGDSSYASTRIDPRRGEAWFCDEAAAQAAGFRPVRGH